MEAFSGLKQINSMHVISNGKKLSGFRTNHFSSSLQNQLTWRTEVPLCDSHQTAAFSPASSEAGFSSVASLISAGRPLGSWVATSACFPCSPFPFIFTLVPANLSFPATFFGFVSTFTGQV